MKPKLFIGSSSESLDIAYAIQENLENDADVVVWKQGIFNVMSNTLDDLVKATGDFDFAIFVFSPVDLVTIREKQTLSVRDNVVFELGLFVSKLGKDRSFIVTPKDAEGFHLPTDLIGVITATFITKDNLQAALGPACNQLRKSIKKLGSRNAAEQIIYDGRTGFEQFDLEDRPNTLFDKEGNPASLKAEGEAKIGSDGVLQIIRQNIDGRFEIYLQHRGPGNPVIYRKTLSPRKIRLACETKVDSGEHTLRFVFKDEQANKILADKTIKVANKTWEQIDLGFPVPPTVDLSFRIDEQVISQTPGSVRIRNLLIAEKIS